MTDEGIDVGTLGEFDAHSDTPRYRQIADRLAVRIQDRSPGVRLPSEHELVRHFRVSRATATQALRDLEQRGLVYRRQGRGTFVADVDRAVRSNVARTLPSFSEDLRAAGHITSERVLSVERTRSPQEVASTLGLGPDDEVWRVERIIVSDGEPVVHLTSWLPAAVYPRVDADQIARTSLYECLESVSGPAGRPSSADEQWSAAQAPDATAEHLELERHTPVMRVGRTAYLEDGTPAESSLSYVRGESFAVAIRIGRGTPGRRVLEHVEESSA
ncbi:GntR family transcriptional regulator [Microbacterium sp. 1P10UB]|uniref:GntR family transcriptional regulator n=1 Tax=unclassified Microbacterium TaxID=2609290 RepID=UPI0039A0E846